MAQCKECGGDLVKKKNKAGELFLVCEDCGKKYKVKQKEEAPVVEEKPAPAPAPEKPAAKKCKECGGNLVKKKSAKTGDIFLVCEDCGKKYKLPAPKKVEEEEEEEQEAPAPAPAPAPEKPAAKKCKACGGDLVKKKSAKTGDIFLVCEDCGKKYKLAVPKKVEEEEEEEEQEAPIPAPAPIVEEPVIPAPVVEEPVAPAPVVEEPAAPAPAAVSNEELASIAKSLQEINKTLKAMLTILNR